MSPNVTIAYLARPMNDMKIVFLVFPVRAPVLAMPYILPLSEFKKKTNTFE